MRHILTLMALVLAAPLSAQSTGSPLIDYSGFKDLTVEVQPYRSKRLITLADFQSRAAKDDALILDARSAAAFKAGHLKGAVNYLCPISPPMLWRRLSEPMNPEKS